MMQSDITKLLERDHELVSELFKKIEAAESATTKLDLFTVLKGELLVHSELEEELLYPNSGIIEDTKDITRHSLREHAEVEEIIGQIETLAPADREWDARLRELKENVEHHVDEEEGELFPRLRKLLQPSRLQELGNEMMQRKQKIALAS